ncbi:DUF6442 family protein [Treponema sp.]|uniref:DUF6442 family protein n=1 Tax=Treponema sp. TaxID=166 RepID=UPI00298E1542|nr:DUF6442 family protein [Treponema sp.]MCQ2240852.1 DUF6442 family protein [Treponema sp.]
MTKDEILQKSRKDNGGKDMEDLEVQKQATMAGYYSCAGLCALITILSYIFTKRISLQCWIIFFGMLSVAFFTKFIKLKKMHELVVAISYLLIFTLLTIAFIFELTGRLPS